MISHERLLELLSYCRKTGEMRWLKDERQNKRHLGALAGYIDSSNGYRKITLEGRQYRAHQLAWFYVYKEWPGHLDHINRIRTDNRIENLRKASKAENARNCGRWFGKQLPKGVSAHSGGFRSRIRFNNKLINLGTFKTIDEAAIAYDRKAIELFGEFASPNARD